jgi:hypothetical protein
VIIADSGPQESFRAIGRRNSTLAFPGEAAYKTTWSGCAAPYVDWALDNLAMVSIAQCNESLLPQLSIRKQPAP